MGRPQALTEEERQELLAEGYRPVEVWVRDRNDPAYLAEVERQCRAAAEADARDDDVMAWVEQVRGDVWSDVPPWDDEQT